MNSTTFFVTHQDVTEDICTDSIGIEPLTCVGEPMLSWFVHHHYLVIVWCTDILWCSMDYYTDQILCCSSIWSEYLFLPFCTWWLWPCLSLSHQISTPPVCLHWCGRGVHWVVFQRNIHWVVSRLLFQSFFHLVLFWRSFSCLCLYRSGLRRVWLCGSLSVHHWFESSVADSPVDLFG